MKNIFFIIGAQRSGTTYLAQLLDSHPSIEMAKPLFPEPKFFLSNDAVNEGKEFYLKKYFQNKSKNVKWMGEKSTSYIESKETARRIKYMFPDSKIIVLLRNPVNRAISNFFFSKSKGIETRSPREVFIENKTLKIDLKKFSVSPINYLGRGEYLGMLKPYISIFGKENVKVLIFEKLIQDNLEIGSIYDFLNIEAIETNFQNLDHNDSEYTDIVTEEVLDHLYDYYFKFNIELENFLNTDLSLWKKSHV